jgi:hypothetical protein
MQEFSEALEKLSPTTPSPNEVSPPKLKRKKKR